MTLREQIDSWYQAGQHENTVQAVLNLVGAQCTDEFMGELAVAYNNLGEYDKALLVLENLRKSFYCTSSWQYRMGYALYYSAMKTPDERKTKRFLQKARDAFETALELQPKKAIRQECLEFLAWIREDLQAAME